jgi:hypothetical protein
VSEPKEKRKCPDCAREVPLVLDAHTIMGGWPICRGSHIPLTEVVEFLRAESRRFAEMAERMESIGQFDPPSLEDE